MIHRAREREQDREKWGKKEKREICASYYKLSTENIFISSLHATSVIIFN